eukprot:GHVR01026967.1.p1 GENE.GHVR01026967.1~~GHVR01026967.1.p1  ORF type:complete len:193 (+),score=7.44 GHVR01026967.1:3-581(+)
MSSQRILRLEADDGYAEVDRLEQRMMKIQSLQDRIQQLENNTHTDKQTRSLDTAHPIGAFFARLSSSISRPSTYRSLSFNTVVYNSGKSFNGGSGIYTCPVSGTYVFHLTGATQSYGYRATICRNYSPFAYLSTGYYSSYAQSSAVVGITSCNRGDHINVRVEHVYSSNVVIYDTYTSFSGFLLHANPLKAV